MSGAYRHGRAAAGEPGDIGALLGVVVGGGWTAASCPTDSGYSKYDVKGSTQPFPFIPVKQVDVTIN